MSLKLTRKKKKHYLLSFFYKLDKLIPLVKQSKLKLYLDLAWIFERLAHEKSSLIPDQSVRKVSFNFLQSKLSQKFSVLDLGCHTGFLTSMIASHSKNVVGIDHNSDHIIKAQQSYKVENIQFIHGEAMMYLYQNTQQFDVLILSHILEHLDSPLPFLENFKKFFHFIYIEVPDFERTHLNLYRKILNSDLIYSDNDHIWEFDRIGIKNLIQESNLEIIDEEFRFGVQKFWCKVIH